MKTIWNLLLRAFSAMKKRIGLNQDLEQTQTTTDPAPPKQEKTEKKNTGQPPDTTYPLW